MMVDLIFWVDGLSAVMVVFFGIVFGLFFIYKAKKTNVKMLTFLGLANLFAGLVFLGVFLDFLFVAFTGTNLNNTYGLIGILSYIWLAPAVVTASYIGGRVIYPKVKWYIFSLFIVLSIVFYIIIFIDPYTSFNFNNPTIPGDGLIDYNLNTFSFAGILMGVFLILIIFLLGIGFLIKSFQNTGVLRIKLILLSIGSICFCVFGMLESLTVPGFALIFVRIGYLSSFWFMYVGLRDSK
jgi:hypothetical protein